MGTPLLLGSCHLPGSLDVSTRTPASAAAVWLLTPSWVVVQVVCPVARDWAVSMQHFKTLQRERGVPSHIGGFLKRLKGILVQGSRKNAMCPQQEWGE